MISAALMIGGVWKLVVGSIVLGAIFVVLAIALGARIATMSDEKVGDS